MNNKVKGWIFGIVIVIVLMIPIIVEYISKNRIDVISYNEYIDLIDSEEFALVYFGDPEANDYIDIKESLTSIKKEFDVSVQTVDYSKINDADMKELQGLFESTSAYVFIKDGAVAYVSDEATTLTRLKILVDKYYNNIIPEEEVAYKIAVDYTEYMKAVNSKNIIMSVYGRDNCYYCNIFKPIYNEVAAEYSLEVYYFDSLSYDKTELTKIHNSGLTIPDACSKTDGESLLSDGYDTPLTIFTKKGKTIDCISGYVDKAKLVSKLKSVGMIK